MNEQLESEILNNLRLLNQTVKEEIITRLNCGHYESVTQLSKIRDSLDEAIRITEHEGE